MDGVVISAAGALTAAGADFPALAQALRQHTDCAHPYESTLPLALAAQVPGQLPELEGFPDDRKATLAVAALEEALEAFGPHLPPPERRALFVGTGLSSVTAPELEEDVYPHLREGRFDRAAMAADLARDRAGPRRHMPARVTAELCRRAGVRGPSGTSFSACAAAAQAIAEGMWAIRRGEADVALVGGHDAMIHPMGLLSFVVLGALSPTRCRPFDRDRDGFVIGEGAAILVLESASRAAARGARPLARLLGAGTSADAHNVTAPPPQGEGAERAMRRALRDAGLRPEEVGYINAHGTGTPVGDAAECAAILRVFGEDTPVSSVKGTLGHTIAAAGAVEAAACVAALSQGFLPGCLGHQQADPALPLRVQADPADSDVPIMLSNSFGFGGQNCSLIFGRAHA